MTDSEIQALIDAPKQLTEKEHKKLRSYTREGAHMRFDVDLESSSTEKFTLKGRISTEDPTDFSIILSVRCRGGKSFNLIRCNGGGHTHRNPIEKNAFTEPHVHRATERYMSRSPSTPEIYAEPCHDYTTPEEAFSYIMKLANIESEAIFLF